MTNTEEHLNRIQRALTSIVGEALSPGAEYLLAYARTCGPEALESLAALREQIGNSGESAGKSGAGRTTDEHLDRIERFLSHQFLSDEALESLTALREQIADDGADLRDATSAAVALREQISALTTERLQIQRAICATACGDDGSEDDDVTYRLDEIVDHIRLLDQQRTERGASLAKLKRQTEEEHAAWKARMAAIGAKLGSE